MERWSVLLLDPNRVLPIAHRARVAEAHALTVATDEVDARRRAGTGPDLLLLASTCDLRAVTGTPRLPALVVHPTADAERLQGALAAGATGFAVVEDGPEALLRAVTTVAQRHAHVPPAMLGGLLHALVQSTRETAPVSDPRFDRLSRREREVLDLLASGKDQQQIAAVLVISPQTARTHIQNVLGKLDVHSRLEAVALAVEHRQIGHRAG